MPGAQRQQPIEYKYYTVQQYVDAGCMQMDELLLGLVIYRLTKGIMCKGCPKADQNCAALFILRREEMVKPRAVTPSETVRDEARRRGVSIKQVRRERRDIANGE